MIAQFITLLRAIELDPTAEEVADTLWLALRITPPTDDEIPGREATQLMRQPDTPDKRALSPMEPFLPPRSTDPAFQPLSTTAPARPRAPVFPAPDLDVVGTVSDSDTVRTVSEWLPFRSPGASALPRRLELERALRPLIRHVPSRTRRVLDVEATVQRIAEQRLAGAEVGWSPVIATGARALA